MLYIYPPEYCFHLLLSHSYRYWSIADKKSVFLISSIFLLIRVDDILINNCFNNMKFCKLYYTIQHSRHTN